MMEWISIKDRMPKTGERVLVWNERLDTISFDVCMESNAVDKHWYDHSMLAVTHWMPLPEPPKP